MRSKFIDLKNALFFTSRNAFVGHAFKGKKLRTLDVGNLGDGVLNVDIKKIVEENGGEHFSLDVNKNLAEHLGYKNQLVGDLHNLKGVVGDNEFDCVYAGQIIEHTWSPGRMVSEANRVLRDGGLLILDTPNIFTFQNVLRFYLKNRDTVGLDDAELVYNEVKDNFENLRNKKKELLSQPQHKILFSPAMMRQLLNMHGFEVVHYAFIGKPENWFYKLFLRFFHQGSQKLGIIARKCSAEDIFQSHE